MQQDIIGIQDLVYKAMEAISNDNNHNKPAFFIKQPNIVFYKFESFKKLMMNLIIVLTVSITLVSAAYASYDHSIDAAVNSHHSVNTYPVHSSKDPIKSPVIDINSGPLPLTIRFNSHSSHINAIQKHFGRPGQVQKATSVDEPDVLIQNVKKPIIQEVREVITPYRHRTQEVRPVQEKVETIIAKHKDHYGGGHYSSGGDGGGGGGGEGSGDEHYEEHETY